MCGIVGAAGWLAKTEKDVFSTMLLVNAQRGVHGAGVCTLAGKVKDLEYKITKTEAPSSYFVFTKDYKDALKPFDMRALMGHSRHATVGKIEIANNHPFEVKEKLVGMHNGTIRGEFEGRKDFVTDSEALMNLIAKVGLKKALENVYENCISPAYALAILNLEDDSISLIRNKERPLYLAKARGEHYWASLPEFLEFAFKRSGVDRYEIEEVPEHALVKIFPMKHEAKERLKIVPDYIKPPKYKYQTTHYYKGDRRGHPFHGNYYGDWSGGWDDYYNRIGARSSTGSETRTYPAADRVGGPNGGKGTTATKQKAEALQHRYFCIGEGSGQLVHHNYLRRLLLQGCAVCGSPETDPTKVRFSPTATDEYFCEACQDTLPEVSHLKWDDCRTVYPFEAADV